jgi:TRAP transporter TAXI family solute receptor
VRRRALLAGALGLPLAGCTASPDPRANLYNGGELIIGTGNTTGVFYQIGAAYADLITRYLPGYDAAAAPSGGSIDNLKRLATSDVDVALTLAAAAIDAYSGTGPWDGRAQPFRALARTYDNYEHVIARADSGITSLAGMKGRKVSLGSPNSGSELIGRKMLRAAGLDPDKDLTGLRMSLPQTTAAMLDGSIDAMIWSGGLPTPGIVDLFARAGNGIVHFVKIQDVLPRIVQDDPNLLSKAVIGKEVYGLPEDTPALSDANLIVVGDSLPDTLAYQLTKLLFEHQEELVKVHPAARGIRRDLATQTEPVPLHPGAQRYFGGH